jgi:prepilin-type processing-associated H-X9-DG protein
MNDVSPSPHVLATVNALALTVNTAIRAVAPILFTSIYATGVNIGWLDGHLFWVVIIILGLLLNIAVYFLPAAAEGRPEQQASD